MSGSAVSSEHEDEAPLPDSSGADASEKPEVGQAGAQTEEDQTNGVMHGDDSASADFDHYMQQVTPQFDAECLPLV